MAVKIEHVALWCRDIDVVKAFYEKYFNATANDRYVNNKKNFHSYFLTFDGGCRLELMQMPGIVEPTHATHQQALGYVHIAISVSNKEGVDALTEQLRRDGYTIAGEPRTTGDGYYESVVLDPEGNRIEITT